MKVADEGLQVHEWEELLNQLRQWTDKPIYIIDLKSRRQVTFEMASPTNTFFIQSLQQDDFGEVFITPLLVDTKKSYQVNLPQFDGGVIRRYVKTTEQDLLELFNITDSEIWINYMLGEGYLPSVTADAILKSMTDPALFTNKSVIIATDYNHPVSTPISGARNIDMSQYYGYLLESVSQNRSIKKLPIWMNLTLLLLLIFLAYLSRLILPSRVHSTSLWISLTALIVISYFSLSQVLIYLPLVEMLIVTFGTRYLLESKERSLEQVQLVVGNRVYSQILESDSNQQLSVTNHKLIEDFSRFAAQLVSISRIFYQLKTHKGLYAYELVDNELQEVQDIGNRLELMQRLTDIKLLNEAECQVLIPKELDDRQIKDIKSIFTKKESYLKPILSHLAMENYEAQAPFYKSVLSTNRSEYLHEKFKRTTDNFINHYFLLKSNFESLKTASILYGLNGEVVQTNQAAEEFTKNNELKIFNVSLLDYLLEVTGLEKQLLQQSLLELIDDQETIFVWPTRQKGFDKNYLITLSIYVNENSRFGGFLLEIVNIEEISYIAKLKNNYVSELNNNLRNDFSEVMLAIDFMNMGVDDGPSLAEINTKLEDIVAKLNSSDTMLKTINQIMRSKQYPVDIRQLVEQSLAEVAEELEQKSLKLVLKQPSFINLVLVNYQQFAKVCKKLLQLAIQDSIDESELKLIISEQEKEGERFVCIRLVTKGYGLYVLDGDQKNQAISEVTTTNFAAIKEQVHTLGGEFSLKSVVGEGSKIEIELPCYRIT